ncbi:MAG: lantibiotic dehydratase [Holophagaceae bacterium]
MAREYKTDKFFAFRTPSLPFDFLMEWSSAMLSPKAKREDLAWSFQADHEAMRTILRRALQRSEVREAIFLASPDLEERLDQWISGNLTDEKRDRVERSLVRYLTRMASRPTPFGLFSGCSIGTWGEESLLKVAGLESGIRHTRLDMDYLCSLVESLERDPLVRSILNYRPNSSLYAAGGQLRYARAQYSAMQGRSYHLVAIEPTAHLQATIELAQMNASFEELTHALISEDINLNEAAEYINKLIDNQILVSDLNPAVTGEEPIWAIMARLLAHPKSTVWGERLKSVLDCLGALDKDISRRSAAVYRELAQHLESLPVKINLKHLFQVDLVKPAPNACLGIKVRQSIEEGIELLRRISPPKGIDPLKRFKELFRERYDSRWVPILEVLDEENGIGPEGHNNLNSELPHFLECLPFPTQKERNQPVFSGRELYLLKHLQANPDELEWDLSPGDLKELESPMLPAYPDAFSAMPIIFASSDTAMDEGKFEVLLENFYGPSGVRLLGRFCHGDRELEYAVREHIAAEEALAQDVVFAEIVHLPEGRIGNILCRPLLRGYEIPFLGVSGAKDEHQIPLQDIYVSVVGERVVLQSKKLGKEVRPRLSTAHNYSKGLGVYRFLCQVQDQHSISSGWSWGSLNDLPHLPRVRRGKHILCRAKWRVHNSEFKEIQKAVGVDAYILFQSWREKRKIPRMVLLADGDNALLVDLGNPLWLETLLSLVAKRQYFELLENIHGFEDLPAVGPEGRFCHELVVPFLGKVEPLTTCNKDRGPSQKFPKNTSIQSTKSSRRFPPGSEWLYFRIYTGNNTSDRILTDHIGPLLEESQELYNRWFFIRYREGGQHLRIRFKGDPHILLSELQPQIYKRILPLISKGLCWKLQLDTFEQEVERYGGPVGIDFAEEFFWRDSQAVLKLIQAYPRDVDSDVRFQLGVKAVDRLLGSMGFDLSAKARIIQIVCESFGSEFHSQQILGVKIGHLFRGSRSVLEALLHDKLSDEIFYPGISVINERDFKLVNCWRQLQIEETSGNLTVTRENLAANYIHMHLNRLMRSAQRAQEFIVYSFLDRLYQSEIARGQKIVNLCKT